MSPNWFVAFPVSAPDLRAAIGAPPPNVRAFHPDDLHATLAFLGSVTPDAAMAAWRALALDVPARAVVLGDVVPLGDPRHPSALSAVVDDAPLRDAIGAARAAVSLAASAPLDARPPLVHVTVARIGRRVTDAERAAAIAWAASLRLAQVPARIDEVALYTWSADRTTRHFRIVERRAL